MSERDRRRLHKVRFRRKNNPDRHLPQFSIDNINSYNARIDHLAIYYPNIGVQYPSSDIQALNNYKLRLKQSRLFDRHKRGIHPLYFSDHYVLGGNEVYFKRPRSSGEYRLTGCPLRLQYNLTRFFANLTPELLEDRQSEYSEILLQKNKPYLKELHDYALDAKDNYLTAEAWRASRNFTESLMLYLNSVRDVVEEQFESLDWEEYRSDNAPARDTSGFLLMPDGLTPILDWRGWQAYRTEIYWDFYHERAVEFVQSIAPRLFQLSAKVFTYARPYRWEDESQKTRFMNAYILSAELKDNVKLVVYAKTPTRIRFEVRYLQDQLDTLISIPHDVTIDNQRLDHIPLLLSYAVQDATNRFSKFAVSLLAEEPSYRLKASPADTVDFYYALYEACDGGKRLMNNIISALHNTGSITATVKKQPELAAAIKELCDRKYLVSAQGQRSVYKIAPKYEPLLSSMMAQTLRKRKAPSERK